MNVYELAGRLCHETAKRRLARIGEAPRDEPDPLASLPEDDRRNWLDLAEAALEIFQPDRDNADRLRELVLDWDRYTLTIKDRAWRDEMRRAVVIEMRMVVDRLWSECLDP